MNISGKQCKSARSLLKWNLRELSFKTNIKPAAIDLFERGQRLLFQADKEKLIRIFKQEGSGFSITVRYVWARRAGQELPLRMNAEI